MLVVRHLMPGHVPGIGRKERAMHEFNQAKSDAFVGKMIDIVNHAALALMTSIGRQTGLLEVMAVLPPSTSADIALAAGLQERYVREWLGAMVTGGIVEYEAGTAEYILPPEYRATLTNAGGLRNLARVTQFIPLLADVEEDVVESFRNGGGVPYAKYPRFQAVMAEASSLRFDDLLVDRIVPLTGMVPDLERGIEVLEIGCGKGHAINLLAQAFPRSRYKGYDISDDGIVAARAEAATLGNTNASFAVRDVTTLNEPRRYDLITAFDVIHDQVRPAAVLDRVADALAPGGTFLMVDIRASSDLHENIPHPFGPFLYGVSTMHCLTVSLAVDGAGLGAVWGEQKALAMLNAAGFGTVDVRSLAEDPFNSYYVAQHGV
jgi:2-polyprenyl-3-methyl-5-hydroxy-6-metoxy-1,4-benzoquinol methylase